MQRHNTITPAAAAAFAEHNPRIYAAVQLVIYADQHVRKLQKAFPEPANATDQEYKDWEAMTNNYGMCVEIVTSELLSTQYCSNAPDAKGADANSPVDVVRVYQSLRKNAIDEALIYSRQSRVSTSLYVPNDAEIAAAVVQNIKGFFNLYYIDRVLRQWMIVQHAYTHCKELNNSLPDKVYKCLYTVITGKQPTTKQHGIFRRLMIDTVAEEISEETLTQLCSFNPEINVDELTQSTLIDTYRICAAKGGNV